MYKPEQLDRSCQWRYDGRSYFWRMPTRTGLHEDSWNVRTTYGYMLWSFWRIARECGWMLLSGIGKWIKSTLQTQEGRFRKQVQVPRSGYLRKPIGECPYSHYRQETNNSETFTEDTWQDVELPYPCYAVYENIMESVHRHEHQSDRAVQRRAAIYILEIWL